MLLTLAISLFISYFIIPVVLLMVIINVYIRIKIVKSYKTLRDKQVELAPGMIFNKPKADAFLRRNYPNEAEKVIGFIGHLRRLIFFSLVGFILILLIFLFIYFSN